MNYKISNEASYDLEKIWLYTFENWSREQAHRYIDLCLNPKSGYDVNHIRKGYFRSKVKSHLIFYKINIKENQLEIIRILHQMMDIENNLGR